MRSAVVAWMLIAQLAAALSPAFTKAALEGLGPWTLVIARQVIGGATLVPLLWFVRNPRRVPTLARTWKDAGRLLACAWAGYSLPLVLIAFGLKHSTATHGALLLALHPLALSAGGVLVLGEALTRPLMAALAAGLVGATLIVFPDATSFTADNLLGDVAIALGQIALSIYSLASKSLLDRATDPWDPMALAIVTIALSVVPLVPFALGEPFDARAAATALPWLLGLALIVTALATYAWNVSLAAVSAGTFAAFIFVQPLAGALLGVVLFGGKLSLLDGWGAALVVAAVVIASRGGRDARV